jgi:hypothetical protein
VKALEGFFHGEHGACRSYLLAKAVLLMLAIDIWTLMIGHAGRYGIDGFNVAHFGWLDVLQPTPSAASYIAVLLLTGLLALFMVCTGLRRAPAIGLFLLYTFSWSMSMLDSYQHHYFVSLILLCLVFFPQTSALEIHPVREPAPGASASARRRHAGRRDETYGWLYVASLVAIVSLYAIADSSAHTWIAFGLFAAAIALATWFYSPARADPLLRPGWGFSLLGATIAIVYAFTALAKIDKSWVQGHTLLQISAAERVFAPLVDLGERIGLSRARSFAWLSTLVIPQEFALGSLYLLAVHQDRLRRRWVRALCLLGFGLAIVLHVGAEAMNLQIGWFSYYMLLLACCYLLPLTVVERLVTVFTWPARWLERHTRAWESRALGVKPKSLCAIAASTALLLLTGNAIDLPGALAACSLAAAVLILMGAWSLFGPRHGDPRRAALAVGLAGAGMWVIIAASPVRWDFYRFLGGDLKRRNELAAALAAYEHGERYAPPGESRAKKIAELRRELANTER